MKLVPEFFQSSYIQQTFFLNGNSFEIQLTEIMVNKLLALIKTFNIVLFESYQDQF